MSALRIGVDTGGTFTDLVALDPETGRIVTWKISSTPENPAEAVLEGLKRLWAKGGGSPEEVVQLVHGTTVATNALLEGKWARTALITTEGFRDVLEIGRQNRPDLYDFFVQKPEPIVPRRLRWEVPERLDFQGRVLRPLNEEVLERIGERLSSEGVESVAVVFLFSYLHPEHERRSREILQRRFRGPIVLSCETLPEFREYERTSTTVLNAALVPVLDRYLQTLEQGVRALGIPHPPQILQSNGGIIGSAQARRLPAALVLSGPAGGVAGAQSLGERVGHRNLITLDMGGTSCDVSVIQSGRPRLRNEGEVAGRPLRLPMLDIQTIGAGGGSIAWIDAGGALRVGPRSAGADPGPACYGRGGEEPTVTDAQLVLGRLDPERPLGDIPRLDLEAARRAVRRIAEPLRLRLEEAAWGIVNVANANMERAIRALTVERGHDPRDFALLAFGGAGPLHAADLAQALKIPTVILPPAAGVFSALGLLTADRVLAFVQTVLQPAERADWAFLRGVLRRFGAEGLRRLREDGLSEERIALVPSLDLRYRGQAFELNVPLSPSELRGLGSETWPSIAQRFHEEHERTYGFSAAEEPLEIVNVRLLVVGRETKPRLARRRLDRPPRPQTHRAVYFEGTGWVECPVYDREALGKPFELEGPAVFAGRDATAVVPPHVEVSADEHGTLFLNVSAEQRAKGKERTTA